MQKLIISLIGLTILCACDKKSETNEENENNQQNSQGYPVLIAEAISKTVPIYSDSFGTLLSPDSIQLTAQVNGQIINVPVKEGQIVQKGDLIAKIDPRTYQAAVDSAKAQLLKDEASLKFAKVTVDSYKLLLPKDYVAALTYAQYVANLETAEAAILADKAAIAQAEINLEYTSIIAPVDGVIGLFQVFPWNFVNAGSQNATITSLQQVKPIDALFSIPESQLHLIRENQKKEPLKVKATFLDPNQKPIEGSIFAINNTIDPQTGTISVKARFENENLEGWPGQFVRLKTLLYEKENATVIPIPAIQIGQNGLYVYVVEPNGTAYPQAVIVDNYYENLAIISNGIVPGQIVITDGQLNLYPGAPVESKSESLNNPDEVQ
jgi:multidrug efflux system membrane fusion protein